MNTQYYEWLNNDCLKHSPWLAHDLYVMVMVLMWLTSVLMWFECNWLIKVSIVATVLVMVNYGVNDDDGWWLMMNIFF